MWFLGHNFGSRYARRSSKSFINARDHLVFKNILSQNFGPWDWGPDPVKIGQKTENAPHIASLSQANPLPESKYFFFNRTKKSFRIC